MCRSVFAPDAFVYCRSFCFCFCRLALRNPFVPFLYATLLHVGLITSALTSKTNGHSLQVDDLTAAVVLVYMAARLLAPAAFATIPTGSILLPAVTTAIAAYFRWMQPTE